MSRFSDIAAGPRARKEVSIDLGRAGLQRLSVRALGPDEEQAVLTGALAFAKSAGVDNAGFGDPLYDLGVQLHTIALAYVDPDSPADKPVPYFAGVEEIRKSDLLTRDHLAFLYEAQLLHQDEVSPYDREANAGEVMSWAAEVAKGNQGPFVSMRPATRWNFTRTLAIRCIASLVAKSLSSQPSEGQTTDQN